ncbi:RNA polymerase sigma factor [Dysgonomonas sp. 521]|uniref:RNA polymerase sigma factor n=1 Tax=Dysgonomonas sp. 521 TaxID=2302932 RepID=UPI0013D5766C|nr:RNA polymerase sigma factor [Dysgonomonas sp. 521]NDV94893.1 RNA polymerase sigma factor [Dysgonomonas sp. 521]
MTKDLAKEQQSVTDIFNKYRSQLKNYITKRVLSKEDSEDILQNVFYQLSKVDLIEKPIEQVSAWLYSVANNQIIDRSRKHREVEMPYVTTQDGEDIFLEEVSSLMLDKDSSPETEYLRTLIWDELEVALSELPEEQREVFELNELEGFSFKEIAEATGITVNTLISRKRYAVLHLRERLQSLYEELLGD